ncbi:hypothetical protein B2K_38750 [Paenibacillus mucilaginosus K02]|uniref:Uncharacterized protein n=1 Tax=Paenibacillus mucilaginosus K02 TaxID=997761 RepID=R9ULA2_9BACL|nr:hypothetical protein B2K_38750 [Paenibacillus mucilaginosus K02]
MGCPADHLSISWLEVEAVDLYTDVLFRFVLLCNPSIYIF